MAPRDSASVDGRRCEVVVSVTVHKHSPYQAYLRNGGIWGKCINRSGWSISKHQSCERELSELTYVKAKPSVAMLLGRIQI